MNESNVTRKSHHMDFSKLALQMDSLEKVILLCPIQIKYTDKINGEKKEMDKGFLTSGGTCDTPTSLSQTGAVHHHPSLVRLLPRLPDNIGCSRRVVIATLSCRKQTLIKYLIN